MIDSVRSASCALPSASCLCHGVTTKRLNEQVKRNRERFPDDFMFQLTVEEAIDFQRSRSQIATLKRGQNIKYLPYAFTEHGAIMAANVLNSKQAVQMSVFVVRAFVKLRETLATHKELADKLTELERKVGTHGKAIVSIITAIRGLTEPAKRKAGVIGFRIRRDEYSGRNPKQHRTSKHAEKK